MNFNITFLLIIIVALIFNYLDITLGMGYGTILSPILIIIGFKLQEVVPALLISGIFSLLIATILNIVLDNLKIGVEKREYLGFNWIFKHPYFIEEIQHDLKDIQTDKITILGFDKLTRDTQVIVIFVVSGIISSIVATFLSTLYSQNPLIDLILQFYIASVVILMGLLVLFKKNRKKNFSLKRTSLFGTIAGLNKALTGGGFGPLSVSGQLISGRSEKQAIASTTAAEFLISLVSFLTYFISSQSFHFQLINYHLILFLMIGAGISAPLAAFTIHKMEKINVDRYIGIGLLLVGFFYLGNILIDQFFLF